MNVQDATVLTYIDGELRQVQLTRDGATATTAIPAGVTLPKDFPLAASPSGWCKTIKGQLHYFGPLDQPPRCAARNATSES